MANSCFFNTECGYLEGITRGFMNGMLKQTDYLNLTQCETMDDLTMSIQSTEYGHIFAGDRKPISVETIERRLREKLVLQYNYLRVNSSEPLSTFLDYIRYEHMINNVALLMAGLNNHRPIKKLLPLCHPLGLFEQLEAITVASNTNELFNAVLIDTPLSKYVSKSIKPQEFSQIDIEIVRSILYKAYLEDFHNFCQRIGGTTADVMGKLLSFQADRRTITIALNSLNMNMSSWERQRLFPICGNLSPVALTLYANSSDYDQIRSLTSKNLEYATVFDNIERDTDNLMTLEDRFLMLEAKKHVHSFLQQFHYGIFYSYIKLKELECRNVVWIAECITQRQLDKVNAYIPIPVY